MAWYDDPLGDDETPALSADLLPVVGQVSVYYPDDYDEEAEEYRRQIPRVNVTYDYDKRMWVCDCKRYRLLGCCLHSYKFRGETVVKVSKDYL
jgi:hypothetical protein